ncbi:MAG TPA: alpha/beta hydrolase [Longimicrobium sp.]
MDVTAFEKQRLELFRRYGFEGESRWLEDADGRKTYAIVRGSGARPTVLVHGGLAEASVWCQVAGNLSGHVVIPDRPGHGLSSSIDYTGINYRSHAADWLKRVVDGLGAEQVDLVGNSMGGYFALAFALAHPERVRRLVLVGAPAGLDRQLPMFIRLWGTSLLGRLIASMKFKDVELLRKRVFPGLVAHPERIPVDVLEVALAAQAKPGYPVTTRTMLNAVSDLGGWRQELLLREPTASVAVPTLFSWGDKDSFAPPSSGSEVAARMPNGRFEILADAGHMPQFDQPAAVAASITRFFSEPDASVSPRSPR